MSVSGEFQRARSLYDTKTRAPSARALRDAELGPALRKLWEDNYRVYGVRKLWKAARLAGHDVGRDQVARLMRSLGIEGVRRGKAVKTTKADPAAARHPDLVNRRFSASAPNQLWVTDLTYVPTWSGVAYVASSSTRSPGRSSGGGSRRTCAPPWSLTRWKWPAGHAETHCRA